MVALLQFFLYLYEDISFIPWGPLPGSWGAAPRFWRKVFQYNPPPPQILAGIAVKFLTL